SAAAERKHVEKHTLRGKTIVTDEANVPHVDRSRVLPGHPRAGFLERRSALQGARKITARSTRNHSEDRVRRRRAGTVEKAASDFVDGSVAAHGDEELEAGGEGFASQSRRVARRVGEGVLERAYRKGESPRDAVPMTAGGPGGRRGVH